MEFSRIKNWKDESLRGEWDISFKIDGVQAVVSSGVALSRSGKPLYNIPDITNGVYEIYLGSWELSVSAVRTKNGTPIKQECVYQLYPAIDYRLVVGSFKNPSKAMIADLLKKAIESGYEGLMLRQGKKLMKVKPITTYDVPVIGHEMGAGKNTGLLGALVTPKGKVGTGFTDDQRDKFIKLKLGTIIEVESMGLTPAGKFRHPRFIRVREDK